MHRKLSKKAILLIGVVCVLVISGFYIFIQVSNKSKDSSIKDTYKVEEVIVENQVLKVQLLDFVSNKNSQEIPTAQYLNIEAKEDIAGVSITNKQSFSKVLHLQSPAEDARVFAYENKLPSHNAYILVLTGDVIKYVDDAKKEKIVVENARVEYYVQSVLLEEAYNSLYISSMDGDKEQMVKVDDYKQAMSNVEAYSEMLQW